MTGETTDTPRTPDLELKMTVILFFSFYDVKKGSNTSHLNCTVFEVSLQGGMTFCLLVYLCVFLGDVFQRPYLSLSDSE